MAHAAEFVARHQAFAQCLKTRIAARDYGWPFERMMMMAGSQMSQLLIRWARGYFTKAEPAGIVGFCGIHELLRGVTLLEP
jgi:hypothetical protein